MNESEFLKSEYRKNIGSQYQLYINYITAQPIIDFKKNLLKDLQYTFNEFIQVNLDKNSRSSYGTKTISFFNGYNKMTLKYKYSGWVFDTTYKPVASVTKVSSTMFFEMNSYTGNFQNSNKKYSVKANGRVITTTGIANNKSYIVNFNL